MNNDLPFKEGSKSDLQQETIELLFKKKSISYEIEPTMRILELFDLFKRKFEKRYTSRQNGNYRLT